MKNKVIAVIGSVLVAFTAVIFTATSVSATSATTGPWDIAEARGCCGIHTSSVSAGAKAVEETNQWRDFTFNFTGASYNGDEVFTIDTNGGGQLASDSNCQNVLIRSVGSQGTDWTIHINNGNAELINRRCDETQWGGSGNSTMALAGLNSPGTQYFLCGGPLNCSGTYRAMRFPPS